MARARNIAESRDFGEPVWQALQQARHYDQTLKGDATAAFGRR